MFFNKLKESKHETNLIQVFSDNEHVIASMSDFLFYYHHFLTPNFLYAHSSFILVQLFSSLDHRFRLKEHYFLVLSSSTGSQYLETFNPYRGLCLLTLLAYSQD